MFDSNVSILVVLYAGNNGLDSRKEAVSTASQQYKLQQEHAGRFQPGPRLEQDRQDSSQVRGGGARGSQCMPRQAWRPGAHAQPGDHQDRARARRSTRREEGARPQRQQLPGQEHGREFGILF